MFCFSPNSLAYCKPQKGKRAGQRTHFWSNPFYIIFHLPSWLSLGVCISLRYKLFQEKVPLLHAVSNMLHYFLFYYFSFFFFLSFFMPATTCSMKTIVLCVIVPDHKVVWEGLWFFHCSFASEAKDPSLPPSD